ncbi:nucleotide sugar dehydrogenase [uncultured Desulfuromusa sp.]|uniref:nucleotide sugar dehydrogenase n=1 Tax=uncultured Desulfuromusa sp. TaxID=219183 RepID=UPI002AA7B19A|nr:nucleotide sugar dehydrogenase [uncultured Desulfuromusa sp.]
MVTIAEIVGKQAKIAVVGLGYVGLPLAAVFGKKVDVIGFEIHTGKVQQLKAGYDATGELTAEDLQNTTIEYTLNPEDLKKADFIIVTVPTPIDKNNNPDLSPVEKASKTIGQNLKKGAIIVYESTVYPGVTEEICVPILEQESGLKCGLDFKVGYSPERINPGDKVHTVEKIKKVVSGMDDETLETVAQVYELVITAGIHRASSIKVAEAAKVIENTQRDLNIALINELALIFNKLDIPTQDVLAAAGTKWNFLKFTPGLVGGHCIGVDPYYLTHKAEQIGYLPQVILAGRRINDGMGKYVAENTVKQMIRSGKVIKGSRVLILGLTFKEDVPDIRNTKVVDIVKELKDYGVEVLVHDPFADAAETFHEYGLELTDLAGVGTVDAVICAVSHQVFKSLTVDNLAEFCSNGNGRGVLVDVKSAYQKQDVEAAGLSYWSL